MLSFRDTSIAAEIVIQKCSISNSFEICCIHLPAILEAHETLTNQGPNAQNVMQESMIMNFLKFQQDISIDHCTSKDHQ